MARALKRSRVVDEEAARVGARQYPRFKQLGAGRTRGLTVLTSQIVCPETVVVHSSAVKQVSKAAPSLSNEANWLRLSIQTVNAFNQNNLFYQSEQLLLVKAPAEMQLKHSRS
ncbi:hypothetical protein [Bradyrhizobium sp. BWA-3-5]|uniref:hypothetical protein n=1 Tax=Bradyrhizobium sp. BWA-3-5 TaxID=3080013 RepID=UPI00293E36AC|nr:hypothetical protein [Bradyrhizobium sp. BWA-3-5]WOH64166.1 hypothetical protein RX331_26720 [Bradyrhizobium sp. BWA-3-5]WOH64283.1 hypothetical protein RX331_27460 [Bradyrhizobium sp. BWA-3-5]WOH70210.1 hypothetical protein RX331_38645 [Bradyrhizobium sp. BWA-3-5]